MPKRPYLAAIAVALALSSQVAAALPEALTYRGGADDTLPVKSRFTFDLTLEGSTSLVQKLRASNPVLTIERLVATRAGRRSISPGQEPARRIDLNFETAHVEVRTASGTQVFDFTPADRPEALKDVLQQASWGLGFAPRSYTVGLLGEYEPGPRADAQAEGMGVVVDGVVRFPARPVTVGDSWTTEWVGIRRQTETGAFFRFSQTAHFDRLVPGPSSRARISYTTLGRLEIPPDRNKQQEETSLEAKGSILFDTQKGTVVGLDTTGSITMHLRTPGITITRTMTASY